MKQSDGASIEASDGSLDFFITNSSNSGWAGNMLARTMTIEHLPRVQSDLKKGNVACHAKAKVSGDLTIVPSQPNAPGSSIIELAKEFHVGGEVKSFYRDVNNEHVPSHTR